MGNTTRLVASLFMLAFWMVAYAQDNEVTGDSKKKYELCPEFTLRGSLGFFNGDHRISGAVNINGKRSVGLMLGHHLCYLDHVPADIDAIVTTLFYRRYFHLGKRKICAFYIDAYAGVSWIYKVTGNRYEVDETGETKPIVDSEPGDVVPILGLQPGFRVRCYKNLHIFLGPSIATDLIGAHIGIGF